MSFRTIKANIEVLQKEPTHILLVNDSAIFFEEIRNKSLQNKSKYPKIASDAKNICKIYISK